MKISEVIRLAGLIEKGNVMEEELAVLWLAELDGMIQSDIMLHSPEEIVSYSSKEDELLLKPPHDKLYVHYLVMMIRQQQQEYEGYQNAQAVVDEKLRTFRRWYVQHYRPAGSLSDNGAVSDPGTWGFAYITAYGLAVQQGYRGTLDEWIESLKGEAGEAARMRYDEERETVQWGVGEQWYDLFTLSELRDPAVDAVIAKAEAAAEAAAGSAQTAETEAQKAQQSMERAGLSAQNANAAAEVAVEAGNVAKDAAADALGYAEDAETQAKAAAESERNSRNNLQEAEVAAQAAQEAARSIGVGGVKVTDGEAVGVWLQAEGTEREPVLHLYGDHGDEPAVVRNVARAELDRDAVPLGQVKELVAAAGGGGGNGSGQNATLTAEQIDALDGLLGVTAFTKADVSAEVAAFWAAFGLDGGDDTPEEPENPGGDDADVSNETTWTDGVVYTYQLVENEYVGSTGTGIKSYEGWSRTPYLYCAGVARIDFANASSLQAYYSAFYDRNRNHLANFAVGNQTVEVPPDAVYFIASGPDDVMQRFTATPFGQGGGELSDYDMAILDARDAWIAEARADSSIVPLVVHTDQHGKLTADNGLFLTLADKIPWNEASACIGLGDTVSNYNVAQFQAMSACLSGIPKNKQINIWGNHDTWFGSSMDNILGEEQLNALNTYFDNSEYPGNQKFNDYGIECMVDEARRIKYVVIGGWEYDHGLGAWNHYVIGADSMDAIIEMLSQADGYDIVLLSHIQPFKKRDTADWIHPPVEDGYSQGGMGGMDVAVSVVVDSHETSLDQMLIDRKNKASGTVRDSYGYDHAYDFSGCNSDLLCCFAGHEHCDKYMWQDGSIPVYLFDAYAYDNHPIYLVNIDRARARMNVWKIDDAPTVYNYQIPLVEPVDPELPGGDDGFDSGLIDLTAQTVVDFGGATHQVLNKHTLIVTSSSSSGYSYIIVNGLTPGAAYDLYMEPYSGNAGSASVYANKTQDATDDSGYGRQIQTNTSVADKYNPLHFALNDEEYGILIYCYASVTGLRLVEVEE